MREIIERAKSKGAEAYEVFVLDSVRRSVEFEASRLKNISETEERGAALRFVKGGRVGFATTTKLSDLDRLVDQAVATAEVGQPSEFGFAGASGPPGIEPVDPGISGLTVDQMIERAQSAVERISDYEKEINVFANTTVDLQTIRVLTSEGCDASFDRTIFQFGVGGRLIEDENILDSDAYFGGTTLGADYKDLTRLAIQGFERGRTNAEISSGPTTVVLTPRAIADVMMTLHGGMNGWWVERGVSPLAGRIGETVFDERVSIYDDGLMDTGHESAPFDDEGVPMQRTALVEAGVLRGFLTDLRTAEKLGLPRTGNGLKVRRIVHTKDLGLVPTPDITNWEMAGGETPSDEIIAGIDDGVVVDSIMGILMSNLIAGDFSGNIALGFKIEKGKLVGRVKNAMIAGNVYKLFKNHIVAVSSDIERAGVLGGIGSHRFPYFVLRDVSIAAKG